MTPKSASAIHNPILDNPHVLGLRRKKIVLDLGFLQNLFDICEGDFHSPDFIRAYLKANGFDVDMPGFTLHRNLIRRFRSGGRPTAPLAVAFCAELPSLFGTAQEDAEAGSEDTADLSDEARDPREVAVASTASPDASGNEDSVLSGVPEYGDIPKAGSEVTATDEETPIDEKEAATEESPDHGMAMEDNAARQPGSMDESPGVSPETGCDPSALPTRLPMETTQEERDISMEHPGGPGAGDDSGEEKEAYQDMQSTVGLPAVPDGEEGPVSKDDTDGPATKVLSPEELVATGNFCYRGKGLALRPDLEEKLLELHASLPIEQALEAIGIPPASLGQDRVDKILRRLHAVRRRNNASEEVIGEEVPGEEVPREESNTGIGSLSDEKLLATGYFVRNRGGVGFHPNFERRLYSRYPDVSIEEGLLEIGLTAEEVGRNRIYRLEKRFERLEGRDPSLYIEGTNCTQYTDEVLKRYADHPYVEECSLKKISLNSRFFEDGHILSDLTMPQILGIFQIEPGLFSTSEVSAMWDRLKETEGGLPHEPTFEELTTCSPQAMTILSNRILALEWMIDRELLAMKENLGEMPQKEKRKLFLGLQDLPKDPSGKLNLSMILNRLQVPRTTYYAILRNETYGDSSQAREEQDEKDVALIRQVLEYKGFKKGARQVYMMLPDLVGVQFALSKIRRLMKKNGIETDIRKPNPAKRQAQKYLKEAVAPNILRRRFRLFKPNEILLTDVTYLTYGETKEKAYCSGIIDAVTGKVTALNVSKRNDIDLVKESLRLAKEDPRIEGSMLHSDQGCLYLTPDFRKEIEEMGLRRSMSRRGNCFDNSPMESFNGTLKEETEYASCESFEELQHLINEYWHYYNHERHRWGREKMTPIQYEEYLLSMDEDDWNAYLLKEQERYDRMREHSAQKAREKARESLGVDVNDE